MASPKDASATGTDAGQGRYEGGLITLPDGSVHGIETVLRVKMRDGETRAQASDVVGALRSALAALSLPPPFRVAASGLRAGLGAIEDGLRPAEGLAEVTITLEDHAPIVALMPVETAILLRRDAELVRGALGRTDERKPEPKAAPSPDAEAEALTSIFRYEKRNGRLRRIAAIEAKPDR